MDVFVNAFATSLKDSGPVMAMYAPLQVTASAFTLPFNPAPIISVLGYY